jgi:hypothetical protein
VSGLSPQRRNLRAVIVLGTLWALIGGAGPLHAGPQPPANEPGAIKRARAVSIPSGRIAIDGRLDEAEWQQAPPADGFVQQQPREGEPATPQHRSEVRFLYDAENLYIGATLHEDETDRLVTNELKRDFGTPRDGDLYIVLLDTFLDRLNAYNFQTNPDCALRDSQSYDDGRTINANWDAVWFCRSSVGVGVWYVEQAVPFKQLRFPRSDEQTWGLQIFRLIRHANEATIWSPTPRQFNQFKTSYEGLLEGIRGIRPGRNIRVKPFVTGQARTAEGRNTGDGDGGVDVKIGVTTSLVLDGTYRTDFSQVETDAQQVNLTRFSLFYPEKREFFLENQGAFQIGPPAASNSNFVPFFSRTIGLSDAGTPVPIVGGVRMTGKIARNSLALLNMQTEEEPRAAGLVNLPAANFSVLRYGREFLTNSTVGVFYLGKERGGTSNRLAGADLRLYPSRALSIDGLFMHSEKTAIGSGDAWRSGMQYNSSLSQFTLQYTSLGEAFRDDLGFIPRQGVDILNAAALRRIRPVSLAPAVREIRLDLPYARYTRDALNPATGGPIGVETETISPTGTVEFSDASTAAFGFLNDEEALTVPFRPQGIPPGEAIPAGRYQFNSASIAYNGSNSRPVAFNGEYRFGGYYNGTRTGFTAGSRVRFSTRLATTISVSRDVIELPDGVTFDTNLASVRVDASFSTRMFLNAFVQYNSVTRQVSSNIRYQFIHHPLSDIFLVYNDTRFTDTGPGGASVPPSRALILKVTHLFSF